MKTLLPIAPSPAPSAPAESAAPRDAGEETESFASMLERRATAHSPRNEGCDTKCEGVAARAEEVEETAHESDAEAQPEEQETELPVPTLVLPLLPYRPIEAPVLHWRPLSGEPQTPETDGGIEADPAQSSPVISAAPSFKQPILAAVQPIELAQPRGQQRGHEKIAKPMIATPIAHQETRTASLPIHAAPTMAPLPIETHAPTVAPVAAAVPAVAAVVPIARELFPQGIAAADAPVTPEQAPLASAPQIPPLVPPPQRTQETALAQDALAPDGTTAARRGEVMQTIAIPASPKPRLAKSADELTTPEIAPLEAVAERPASSPKQAMLPLAGGGPADRPIPNRRTMREVPGEFLQPAVAVTSASAPVLATGPEAAPNIEVAKAFAREQRPAFEPHVPLEVNAPAAYPTPLPQAERVTTEPAAPITRAEIVQIVERTADAAVRLRAAGTERIEVAVQLESGDRLTIQLRLANGEVTPIFRTASDALRTALEQNWAQFTDRAGERGVRMTPPIFDVNSSSSNMTDLSQQRDGRHPAHAQAQTELFPNLPRRMRPPRVLAAAPLESASAATAGVRTYA